MLLYQLGSFNEAHRREDKAAVKAINHCNQVKHSRDVTHNISNFSSSNLLSQLFEQ